MIRLDHFQVNSYLSGGCNDRQISEELIQKMRGHITRGMAQRYSKKSVELKYSTFWRAGTGRPINEAVICSYGGEAATARMTVPVWLV